MFIVIIATFYAYSPKTIPIGYLIHYNLKINFSNITKYIIKTISLSAKTSIIYNSIQDKSLDIFVYQFYFDFLINTITYNFKIP